MKRILSIVLTALLAVSVFSACTPGNVDPTEGATEYYEPIRLANKGATTYAIYFEDAADEDAAYALKTSLDSIVGTKIDMKNEAPNGLYKAIIVGRSSIEGENTYTIDNAALGANGYVMKEAESCLILAGVSHNGTLLAVNDFIKTYLGFDVLNTQKPEKVQTVNFPKGLNKVVKSEEASSIMISGKSISEFTIVYSHLTTAEVEKSVTASLKSIINEITGYTIATANDGSTINGKSCILIGETDLESQLGLAVDRNAMAEGDFVIKTNENGIIITGKDSNGTVAAVYYWLENVLGYTEAGFNADLPKADVTISASEIKGNVGFKAYSRYEFDYSELRANNSKFTDTTICFSDTEALRKTSNAIKAKARISTDAVSCVFNKYSVPCTCSACKQAAEEEGTPYGAYFRYVNSLAELVEQTNPNVKLEILAYKNTYKAPKTPLRDNVKVILCNECVDYNGETLGMCSGHAIDCADCETNKAFIETLNDWKKVCKHVYVLDMTSDYYYFPATFPTWFTIYDNLKYYYTNGVEGVYFQTENSSQNQDFLEFRFMRDYLVRQFALNPKMDKNAYMSCLDGYLKKAYGQYADAMKSYMTMFAEAANTHCYNTYTLPENMLSIEKKDGSGAKAYDLTLAQKLFDCWNNSVSVYKTAEDGGTFLGKVMIEYLRKADKSSNVEHARVQFSKWLSAVVHPFDETDVYNALIRNSK